MEEYTLDDIKNELKDYFSNQTIIKEYEKANGKIEELFAKATKTTTIISDMPKGSSEVQDRAAECIAEYVDLQRANIELEREYAVGMMNLKHRNLIIHKTIMKMKSPLRAILMHMYEHNKTRQETADIMGKSIKWVDTLVGVAFTEYLKIRNEKE